MLKVRHQPAHSAGQAHSRRLPASGDEARLPPRRASTGRRTDALDGKAGTNEQPRDHGVRVPHITRPELVSAPDLARHPADEAEEATGQAYVVAQALGT
jgi:hypothetical protein